MPLITVSQAASVILISVVGLILSGVLLKPRSKNRYPVQRVSVITSLVSVWLLINVLADRTINIFWF
ncbi:MAG: hypothetical protein Q8P33_03665, partial [bacterium]|nr:hypothetical protein [bacterium]